jgi:hypothetical protein
MKSKYKTIAITISAVFGIFIGFVSHAQTIDKSMTLYKNPQCGCCEDYAKYLRQNGFDVSVKPTHNLVVMSREAGIQDNFQGCHLSLIDGYFVSGHVPIDSINKLLSERPDIKGITLPNMPAGSPGMSGVKSKPFTILSISDDEPEVYNIE